MKITKLENGKFKLIPEPLPNGRLGYPKVHDRFEHEGKVYQIMDHPESYFNNGTLLYIAEVKEIDTP